MSRILQHPLLARVFPLQDLEDAFVVAKRRLLIGSGDVLVVASDLPHAVEPAFRPEGHRQDWRAIHRSICKTISDLRAACLASPELTSRAFDKQSHQPQESCWRPEMQASK